MAGTREALELLSVYKWSTEPLKLIKGQGTWAEQNVPRAIVFGTELNTLNGGVRETVTLSSSNWNSQALRLETELTANISAGPSGDLSFNRLAIVRGGKTQGAYTADFVASTNTIVLTSAVPEPFAPGDKLVRSDNFASYTVTAVSGNELTVSETILADATGIDVHCASGKLMLVYVFIQGLTVFANTSVAVRMSGYDFAS